jgi:hypothetical protein
MAITHADATATQAVERYLLGELSAEERDQFEAHAFDCVECAEDLKAAAMFLDTSRSVLGEDPLARSAFVRSAMARSTWDPSATGRSATVQSDTPSGSAEAANSPSPRAQAARHAGRGWRAWLNPAALMPSYALVPAMVLLLGFTLYQNLVTLPALRNSSAPRALSAFSFVSSGTRGATPMVIAAPPRQPFLLFFDIPPGGRFTSYHCAIVAEDGTPQVTVDVSAAQARDTVQLFVPAARLHPGPHTLVITGDTTGETGAAVAAAAMTAKQEIARYPFVLQGGA